MSPTRPVILHLGDPIEHNLYILERLHSRFDIVETSLADLNRPAFIHHLQERTWGDFDAIMRPFWNTGGEMGKWDKELIELLPASVKIYASAGAGYDWVDVGCLAEHGILYCNGAGASTEAVADMALYHILSVFRNMTWSHLAARSLDSEKWLDAHRNAPSLSHNPRGHTLGIIGLGNIGYAIAQKAFSAFGMKVLYNDVARKTAKQEQAVQATFYEHLEHMLNVSDCVLLATPFSGSALITASTLAQFKLGSRFVNIARGSLVDEEALADAIESGHLSAAGLDVHAREPRVSERLVKSWNVTVTSHSGGGALETIVGFERLAMENVERVLTGEPALTGVNGHLMEQYTNGNT